MTLAAQNTKSFPEHVHHAITCVGCRRVHSSRPAIRQEVADIELPTNEGRRLFAFWMNLVGFLPSKRYKRIQFQIQMIASKIVEKAPSWFTRLLLPEIGEIKGELKALNGKIDSLNTKMHAEFKVVHSDKEVR